MYQTMYQTMWYRLNDIWFQSEVKQILKLTTNQLTNKTRRWRESRCSQSIHYYHEPSSTINPKWGNHLPELSISRDCLMNTATPSRFHLISSLKKEPVPPLLEIWSKDLNNTPTPRLTIACVFWRLFSLRCRLFLWCRLLGNSSGLLCHGGSLLGDSLLLGCL